MLSGGGNFKVQSLGAKFQGKFPYFGDRSTRISLQQSVGHVEVNSCAKDKLDPFSRFRRIPTCDRHKTIAYASLAWSRAVYQVTNLYGAKVKSCYSNGSLHRWCAEASSLVRLANNITYIDHGHAYVCPPHEVTLLVCWIWASKIHVHSFLGSPESTTNSTSIGTAVLQDSRGHRPRYFGSNRPHLMLRIARRLIM